MIAALAGQGTLAVRSETAAFGADAASIVLVAPRGSTSADQEILRWQNRLKEDSKRSAYWERLGWTYVAKARATQDSGFYKLAELTAAAWENACGPSLDLQLLRGHVAHNLHRFAQAEALARELVAQRQNPLDYALLSDALMEQGKLDEAVAACQSLVNLRPGPEALTRIAHLRWLFGDLNGAVQAMQDALRATHVRDAETRAWIHARLAHYALLQNRPAEALVQAEAALSLAPDHPLALAEKGRALYGSGEYKTAAVALKKAAELNPIPENQWWLADTLAILGEDAEGKAVEVALRKRGAGADPRSLALFLATRGEDLDRAVRLVSEELNTRADVFTHDAYAFALLRAGRRDEADAEFKRALDQPTRDPRLCLHAGLWAEAAGDREEAQRAFLRAKGMAAALTPSEQQLLTTRLNPSLAATP